LFISICQTLARIDKGKLFSKTRYLTLPFVAQIPRVCLAEYSLSTVMHMHIYAPIIHRRRHAGAQDMYRVPHVRVPIIVRINLTVIATILSNIISTQREIQYKDYSFYEGISSAPMSITSRLRFANWISLSSLVTGCYYLREN